MSTIIDIGSGGSGTGAVSSVFNRSGDVVAATNDYTWAQIDKSTSSLADLGTKSAAALTSGSLDGDRLAAPSSTKRGGVKQTGTPSGKFLKDDDTWATPTITETDPVFGASAAAGISSGNISAWTGAVSTANAALPSASFTDAAVTGKLLTGFTSGAGTVAATDTILQAANKLDGNIAARAKVDGSTNITGDQTFLKNVILTNAPASNVNGSGICAIVTAGENLTVGQVVYKYTDATLKLAKGDSASTCPAIAMAMGSISSAATGQVLKQGFFRNDSWSWTIGGLIYLSAATGGLMTQTKPSATGNQVQILGIAVSATVIYFNPNLMVIELA